MPSAGVRAHALSYSFGALPLFTDVSFHLSAGWTGLVGENGAGKSTLLELIAGLRSPEEGRLERWPLHGEVTLCPQRVELLSPAIQSLAEAQDAEAFTLRGRLQLEPEALLHWPHLSPGERKRWQLAAALLRRPEVLLLDEPANHLDASAQSWLLPVLRQYSGVGIIVSHDRSLLDALTRSTLRLRGRTARHWPGSYSSARESWLQEERGVREARDEAKSRMKKAQHAAQEARQRHASATRSRSTGARMKNPYDSDARTLGAAFLAERAQGAMAQALRRRQREVDQAESSLEQLKVEPEVGRDVFLGYAPCPRPKIATLITSELRAGPVPVLHDVNLSVGREERMALMGPNGAGKSTLLQALFEAAALPADRVLMLPQDLLAEQERQMLQEVKGLAPEIQGRVWQLMASLGTDPQRLLLSQSPSPGESRKLALAMGLALHVWALFLDEPTHHLDALTLERLEGALAAFPGALVMATHDERLIQATACTPWRLEAQRVARL